jgi:hypothetical protein
MSIVVNNPSHLIPLPDIDTMGRRGEPTKETPRRKACWRFPMANKKTAISESEAVAMIFGPALLSIVALLVQIRDGKGPKDVESAINEARRIIHLATPVEPTSHASKA